MQGQSQHFELTKSYDKTIFQFHKRKNDSEQWLLQYLLHKRLREIGLGALKNVSLKQARELATQ
ncbi:Arm DNA-binding domain-containing protein [Bartonella koehlerae]|uniref:Uncharacterized protein n=1 Tax=Bartonella koehlerae C-29 TaxID=1134510 RepID=A0A067WKV4_9HYPH|nr:Arm DNA-binding domain-containing protein [Bartonella koehlerae]KEC56542.1 hypothetical protein O9A_00036 [Bartonella koehlerae C-29]